MKDPLRYPTLDISDAHNSDFEYLMFDEHLKAIDLFGPEYLYTGVDGAKLKRLLKDGIHNTRRRTTFCFNHADLQKAREDGNAMGDHPLKYAAHYEKPAIIVYRAADLKPAPYQWQYEPADTKTFRDALAGVFRVKAEED